MDERGERLREAFQFEAADLPANRAGRLSARQAALLRAGRTGMRISLAVFAVVMCGTVGVLAVSMWPEHAGGGPGGREGWIGLGAVIAVGLVAIGIGIGTSRGHLAAARSRRIGVARGPAAVVSAGPDGYRVRIGPTELRVAGEAQLAAFAPAAEYRVYYLPGPVAFVLSAEVVGAEAGGVAAAAPAGAAPGRSDPRVATIRRGSVVVVLLGGLALGIPLVVLATAGLPEGARWLVALGLLAVAIGFAGFALRWLPPRSQSPSE
jgi:hypothetical protein